MKKMRVADYIAQRIVAEGVDTVFLLSGGGMMHLLDALACEKRIKVVSQHHEQCSGFAADAYARITERFGVCYGTSGPGASNLVTSIVNSWQDSVPVLYITGQSKLAHTIRNSQIEGLRQYGTFEVDIIPIVRSITKYSHFLSNPDEIDTVLDQAINHMLTGRPGPALIDIPVDIQGAHINKQLSQSKMALNSVYNKPSRTEVTDLLRKIAQYNRPILLAGHGVRMSNSVSSFKKFIDMFNLPTVVTPMASDLVEYSHPLMIGHLGVKGDRPGNITIQNADLILTLGCSLHAMTTGYELDQFAPHAYKIQIEIDEAIQKRESVGVAEKHSWLIQDFLEVASECLAQNKGIKLSVDAWIQHCHLLKKDLDQANEPLPKDEYKMDFYDIINLINKTSLPHECIVVDAGLPFYLAGQALKVKNAQRVIIPGALGQMGYALPAATGIHAASPNKRVYVLVGDGSFQTNIHELSVYKYQKGDIKVILINNNGYVSIRNTQNNYFNSRLIGTDPEHGVFFPDHKKICESYSLPYFSVKNKAHANQEIEKFFNMSGPAILEVFVSESQEVMPSVQSQKLPDGRMISKPIQDMYPYLPPETLKKYLI